MIGNLLGRSGAFAVLCAGLFVASGAFAEYQQLPGGPGGLQGQGGYPNSGLGQQLGGQQTGGYGLAPDQINAIVQQCLPARDWRTVGGVRKSYVRPIPYIFALSSRLNEQVEGLRDYVFGLGIMPQINQAMQNNPQAKYNQTYLGMAELDNTKRYTEEMLANATNLNKLKWRREPTNPGFYESFAVMTQTLYATFSVTGMFQQAVSQVVFNAPVNNAITADNVSAIAEKITCVDALKLELARWQSVAQKNSNWSWTASGIQFLKQTLVFGQTTPQQLYQQLQQTRATAGPQGLEQPWGWMQRFLIVYQQYLPQLIQETRNAAQAAQQGQPNAMAAVDAQWALFFAPAYNPFSAMPRGQNGGNPLSLWDYLTSHGGMNQIQSVGMGQPYTALPTPIYPQDAQGDQTQLLANNPNQVAQPVFPSGNVTTPNGQTIPLTPPGYSSVPNITIVNNNNVNGTGTQTVGTGSLSGGLPGSNGNQQPIPINNAGYPLQPMAPTQNTLNAPGDSAPPMTNQPLPSGQLPSAPAVNVTVPSNLRPIQLDTRPEVDYEVGTN